MIVNSSHDIFVFIISLICGMLIGLVFDFFRAVRKVFKSGKKAVAFQDVLLCTAVFIMISCTIDIFNDGSVRWYEIAGIVFGTMLYLCTVSFVVMKCLVFVLEFIKCTTEKMRKVFLRIYRFSKEKVLAIWSPARKKWDSFFAKFAKKREDAKKINEI